MSDDLKFRWLKFFEQEKDGLHDMILALVWVDSRWLTQNTLRYGIRASNLWRAVNRLLSPTMWARWLPTYMSMWALDLLHSATLRSSHWRLRLLSQPTVRLWLLTHYTLVVMRIILDWAILLLTWILCGIILLEHCWCAWSLLFRAAYCCILWLRGGSDWLLCRYNRWIFLENLVEVQSWCRDALFLLNFSIVKLYQGRQLPHDVRSIVWVICTRVVWEP